MTLREVAPDTLFPPSSAPSAAAGDRWYVTNGVVAIGPISFELLRRGARSGRVPSGSFVRHETWNVWRRLDEIDALGFEVRHETVQSLASYTFGMDARASSPLSEPPPPPTERQLPNSAIEENTPRSTFRPTIVDPIGVLAHAADLSEALLLTVSTAVAAAGAEIGLVHRVRHDLHSIVTIGGHGPKTELLLGERLLHDDPTLVAARAGHTVVGEPQFGEISRYVLGRLGRCLPSVRGVAMVPLVLFGELVALFEIGRSSQPFRAREVGRAEDVIEALAERSVVTGWLE
jgi:hypothetical protein